MNEPNTFIVGAPKCGTTALASYLSGNPSVFVSSPKEPHYFVGSEYPKKTEYHNLDDYLKIFSLANENHRVLIDASVWYLYSKTAIPRIAKFNPESKIIVMLRRPDEMLYSMHSQNMVSLQEDIADFEKAWRLSLESPRRVSYSRLCKAPQLLRYNKIAVYSPQISRVYDFFSREQVYIMLFDDFVKDTAGEYKKLLHFLGVECDSRYAFNIVNPNKKIRNKRVGEFVKAPPERLVKLANGLKKITGIKRLGIKDGIRLLNERATERTPMPDNLRREIIDYHREDLNQLSDLVNKNLSSWVRI